MILRPIVYPSQTTTRQFMTQSFPIHATPGQCGRRTRFLFRKLVYAMDKLWPWESVRAHETDIDIFRDLYIVGGKYLALLNRHEEKPKERREGVGVRFRNMIGEETTVKTRLDWKAKSIYCLSFQHIISYPFLYSLCHRNPTLAIMLILRIWDMIVQ